MQNKTIKMLRNLLVMITAGFILASCNKKFDEPPTFIDPNITPNTSIKELKAMHTIGAFEKITQDIIIGGVVVADDKSGNFYKSIAIQDATGGITIRLDGTNLYTQYPVGRMIYVKLNGLYLGDYNRLIQIGGGIDDSDPARPDLMPIASGLFDQYIIKGSLDNVVTPKLVTVAQLHDSLQSTLIQLDNMEFIAADTSKTYADAVSNGSRNLNVKGCGGNSVIVRTSGFANFAGVNVPNGNGTLIAVYTMFGSTKQLVIRDPSDVQFNDPRCGAGPTADMNISNLRALFTGSDVTIPNGTKIRGIVISDRAANNQDDNNLVMQQGTGLSGIMVRFEDPHTFDLGDSVEINISNQSLEEFSGTLQVNGVPNNFATKVGTGTITPRVATTAEINTNSEAWESTLVKIVDVTSITNTASANWGGNVTLTDAAGTIIAFTRNAATFSSTPFPSNASSITGYVGQFNTTKEIILRNLNDVVAGTTPPPPPPPAGSDLYFSEYVEGSSNNKYLEIYNGGTAAANLADYVVKLYSNGGTSATNQVRLDTLPGLTTTTLAPGAVLVLKNGSAALTLPAGVTAYVHNVTNFNGDDAIELEKNGVVIDVFGEKGVDPGSSWTIAGNTSGAQDKSVRRNATVTEGNINWTTSSDTEWTVITTLNDVSNLGAR